MPRSSMMEYTFTLKYQLADDDRDPDALVERLGEALALLDLDEQDGTPVAGQRHREGGRHGRLPGAALAGAHYILFSHRKYPFLQPSSEP